MHGIIGVIVHGVEVLQGHGNGDGGCGDVDSGRGGGEKAGFSRGCC